MFPAIVVRGAYWRGFLRANDLLLIKSPGRLGSMGNSNNVNPANQFSFMQQIETFPLSDGDKTAEQTKVIRSRIGNPDASGNNHTSTSELIPCSW